VRERPRRDLVRRVAGEHRGLTEPFGQVAQPVLDRGVELPDRLVVVALGRSVRRRRLLQPQEHPQRLGPERDQRQLQRPIAVRHRARMAGQDGRRVQSRRTADGVQQVRRQREVDHLLGEHAAHHLHGVRVALRVE
jgi:hypothetical protein